MILKKRQISKELVVRCIPYLIVVAGLVYVGVVNTHFFTYRNVITILLQASSTALMAIGMTFVYLTGGIDLSMPPVMALGAILGAMFMKNGGGPWGAVAIMVGLGCIMGLVNGLAVSRLKMPPFIVTLATQNIAYGACEWLTKSAAVTGIHPGFTSTVMHKFGSFPLPILFMVFVMIAAEIFLKKSYCGRWFYYTGNNAQMAKIAGIPTEKVICSAYIISGFLASLAGMILTARMNAATANFGQDTVVMDIVGAAVIGGASVNGGVGNAIGAVFGAIFVSLIVNAANMLNVSYNAMLVLKGALIIVFVAIDGWSRRRRNRV